MKFENTNSRSCRNRKKYIFSAALLIAFLAVFSFSLSAQDTDNQVFWFVAPDAADTHDDSPAFFMITTGDRAARVTISMPANAEGFTPITETIAAYSYWKVTFGRQVSQGQTQYEYNYDIDLIENDYTSSGTPTQKGILIESSAPVSVYYQIDGFQNYQKEIFNLKGKKALGKDFYMPFQKAYPLSDREAYNNKQYRQIQIVATEDNTEVTIHPRSTNAKFSVQEGMGGTSECKDVPQVDGNNTTFVELCYHYINSASDESFRTRTLNKGETLLWREAVRNTPDLTGTRIEATRPIAVTLFEDCVEGGTPGGSADPIGDQLVPVDNLGQHYIVIKGYSSGDADDHAVVLAVKEDELTKVWVRAEGQSEEHLAATLTQGQSDTIKLGKGAASPGAYYIRTDNPVYCMHQSATGTEVGGALLPSLYSISGRRITFVKAKTMRYGTNNVNLGTNAMFLVFRESAKDGFTLDGDSIQNFQPKAIGFDGWYYAKVNLPEEEMICTVANEKGSFALGYFHGTPTGTSLYGYLSAFGTFSFDSDTIYHCGDSYQFDAPYARTYTWTLPSGSILSDTSRLVAKQSGHYILYVEQDPYKITDTTYLKLQNFNHKLSAPDSLLVNKSYNFMIELKSDEVHDNRFNAKYEWNFGDDASVTTSNGREVKISFTKPGTQEISLQIWNYADYPNFEDYQALCDTIIEFKIEVPATPEEMYWRSDAQNKDWNDKDNWVDAEGKPLSVVPSAETKVYLPGNADKYPSLKDDKEGHTDWRFYGQPEVNGIIFRYGSELGFQHKLDYKKAYVNYNWYYYNNQFTSEQPEYSIENNARKLERDVWHALAAPLKKMASGDFSLAGYPFSWQSRFEIKDGGVTEGDLSKPFPTNDEDLGKNNNAIAVKMAGYQPQTGYYQQYLEGLKGVIEIPYFQNNNVTQYYPAHNYDALSKKSYFYYYDTKTLRIINSPVGSMKRAGESYRFVYEDADGKPPVSGIYEVDIEISEGAREVMVGNPLLAPIEAMDFLEVNGNTINEDYGYKLLSEDGKTWKHHNFATGNTIPAWKAFIVTLQDGANTLSFPLEPQGVEPTSDMASFITNNTRSSYAVGPADDALYVQVLKGGIRSGDAARLQHNRHTDKPDIRKMILPEGHRTPEVFFISMDGKSSNLIQQYKPGEKEVAIGIKTSDVNSRLSLEFGNIAAFSASTGASIILVDKRQNARQDLTRNPVYSFTQQASGLDNQYVDRHRFVLQLSGDVGPEAEDDAVNGIDIVYRSGILEVTSDENINTVSVYDLHGRLVFSSPSINLSRYSHPVSLQSKMYLVRVKTVSGKEKVRKIMGN